MKKIVLTGGPNSGKSTALTIMKEIFGSKIAVVQEAATMIYSGGYPRKDDCNTHRFHAQRIIFFITGELESLSEKTAHSEAKVILCDRGSLDGAAYWPLGPEDFFKHMNTTKEKELAKYDMVIHMSPPLSKDLYDKTAVRTETPDLAQKIDKSFMKIYESHPNRIIIDKTASYLEKAEIIKKILTDIIEGQK